MAETGPARSAAVRTLAARVLSAGVAAVKPSSCSAPGDRREGELPARRLRLVPSPETSAGTVATRDADASGGRSTKARDPFGAIPSDASDSRLVASCLAGDDTAWACLMSRYRRLIYSIPLKYGATPDVAADIFQAVCVDLVAELPKLRKPEAIKGWLMRVTQHKCLRWKASRRRQAAVAAIDEDTIVAVDPSPTAAQIMESVEREAAVRAAVSALPERQRALVGMLFFTTPALPYAEIAQRLGLATGSIGFLRGRCLKKLERALDKAGF